MYFKSFFVLILGLTITEKWNTENNIETAITIEDQLVKGLKLSFDTQFSPQTGYIFASFSSYDLHCLVLLTFIYP